MALIKGGFLRLLQTLLYALAFGCAAVILGIYSYFLSVLADRNAFIARYIKAVEGIAGAAVLYTIFAVVLTCCLGGISFFAFLAIVLDVAFVGGMIAIAIMARDGASSCTGIVDTPLGRGNSASDSSGFGGDFGLGSNDNATYKVSPRTACRMNTAVFAVAVIGAFLFIITAAMQVFLVRHHKKEKRYGPSPSNNYTSGFGKRKFWQRKPKATATRDAEMAGGAGLAPVAADTRPSYETSTTLGNTGHTHDKVEANTVAPIGSHSGYYTQPQGTGVNPYGYTTATGAATNY